MISTKAIARSLLALGAVGAALLLVPRASRPVSGPSRQPVPEVARSRGPVVPAVARTEPVAVPAAAPASVPVDPLAPRDAGYRVITNLQNTGAYDVAARYAAVGPEAFRRDLVIAAYHEWGRREPAAALASAVHLSDAAARETAVQSVWSGWARADPAGLAETALDFPEGDDRNAALTKAIRAWMIADPWQAGDWVLAHNGALAAADTVFRTEQR